MSLNHDWGFSSSSDTNTQSIRSPCHCVTMINDLNDTASTSILALDKKNFTKTHNNLSLNVNIAHSRRHLGISGICFLGI